MSNLQTQSRVLVVEDEPSLLESIVDILTFEGHTVAGVKNGKLAVEYIQAYLPDIVITDVMMPEMDGYQLVKVIRDDPLTAATPVILLSGHTDPDFIREGLALGANLFIKKPFKLEDLVNAMDRILNASRH